MRSQAIPMTMDAALAALPTWLPVSGRAAIHKTFAFEDFKQAFAWMTRIALKAEQMDHHPEWSNIYNKVHVTLTTHDAGGVTSLDVTLAEYMDASL